MISRSLQQRCGATLSLLAHLRMSRVNKFTHSHSRTTRCTSNPSHVAHPSANRPKQERPFMAPLWWCWEGTIAITTTATTTTAATVASTTVAGGVAHDLRALAMVKAASMP